MKISLPIMLKIQLVKKKIEVQQDKIDNLIEYNNEIIAIKIDVERMELDVLKGAENLLKKK